jgi:hypothetical protein
VEGSGADDFDFFGVGLYTATEASRLTGIAPARLRRWLRGYTYRAGEPVTEPVWQRQVPDVNSTLGLGR